MYSAILEPLVGIILFCSIKRRENIRVLRRGPYHTYDAPPGIEHDRGLAMKGEQHCSTGPSIVRSAFIALLGRLFP